MHRYYDPARGRFTTPDPAASGTIARPNSWNRYAYTEGDPVNFYDPQGLQRVPPGFYAGPLESEGSNQSAWSSTGTGHPYLTAELGVDAMEQVSGGGGSRLSVHDLLKMAFDKVQSDIEKAATKSISAHVIDCWAGMESNFNPKATSPGGSHKGLFQLNQAAWTASGVDATFTNENAFNAAVNAAAAVGYLTSLFSQAGGGIADGLTAYRWGRNASNPNSAYSTKILDCAKKLDSGDWDGAMSAIGR